MSLIAGFVFQASSIKSATIPVTPKPSTIPVSGTWNLDPMHCSITFSIRHFGISDVQGRFDKFSGTIVADAVQPNFSTVDITIQSYSVNTNQSLRDGDLRSKNYLDVVDYPAITYKSTTCHQTGPSTYVVIGDLTIHGVSKVVTLPFTLYGPIKDPNGITRIGLETSTVVNRLAYGVGGNAKISDGSFALGNEVPIKISVEAIRGKPQKM